jgi:hypothetical protein
MFRHGSATSSTTAAQAVASAFYLILDLSSPYSGLFGASPAPLEAGLAAMGKE